MFDVFTILQDHGMLFLMGQYPNGPLGGVLCTLLISLLAVVLSFPLGVLVGLARLSPWRGLRWAAACWVYTLRGIPQDDGLMISANVVQSPVFYGHAQMVSFEAQRPLAAEEARDAFSLGEDIELSEEGEFPTQVGDASGNARLSVGCVVWALVIIHGSALAPQLEVVSYIMTGVVAFLMCIQARQLILSFVPGTFIGACATFAAGGDWRLVVPSLALGLVFGYAMKNSGLWLATRAT